MSFMGIRLHEATKKRLEHIAGQDYSMDEVVQILLDNFIEPEERDRAQSSLFDYTRNDKECPRCQEPLTKKGKCLGCGYPEE